MATLRTSVQLAAIARPDVRAELPDVVVDPDSIYSWFPSSVLDALGVTRERVDQLELGGSVYERSIGFVRLATAGRDTVTVCVFGLESDKVLLGAHALSGLNLRADPFRNALVDGGPITAAAVRAA